MTAIDTNVVIGLLSEDDAFNILAKRALLRAAAKGPLVLSPPVYIELCAMPKRDNFHLETFLRRAHILVDWMLEEAIWRAAGAANAQYVERRRANRQTPRRIAARLPYRCTCDAPRRGVVDLRQAHVQNLFSEREDRRALGVNSSGSS